MANGKTEAPYLFTLFDDSDTRATGSTLNDSRTYNVIGNGIVIVFGGVLSDANDTGTYHVEIKHNGSVIMGAGTRWGTASTNPLGENTAAPIAVSNGDTVGISLYNTKYASGGTFECYRRIACYGCEVQRAT